ncbi:MAG: AbrB/MazE/SpoVT family DNA-binding domain-containing protein [Clostridia bacterium]|nr:AbrB/MazE/SpoVT family DNA-binding domain-containing protein [Clostridia bacterium]
MNYGITKIIDRLGRVVIPKELRKYYNIAEKEKIELIPTEAGILIRKCGKQNDSDVK